MSNISQAMVKVVVLPVFHTVSGPVVGLYRGIMGEGTPVNYAKIDFAHPHEDGRDIPSNLGKYTSYALGTATSAVPWGAGRLGRAAVETVIDSYQALGDYSSYKSERPTEHETE